MISSKKIITSEPWQERIEIEEVKSLYESIGSLLLINFSVCLALSYAVWVEYPSNSIYFWVGLMMAMLFVRALFFYRFHQGFDPEKMGLYSRRLIIGSLAAGIVWGIGGIILFVPDRLDYQLFILASLLVMTGGSTFTLSNYLPAFFAYAPASLLPITILMLSIDEPIYLALSAVTIIFLVAVTFFNFKSNKAFKLSYQLRFENDDLIEQLKIRTADANRANRAKSKFLAAASHDLRQPLYAISLFLGALQAMKKSDEVEAIIVKLSSATTSLNSLFDALLDISKLDAGVVRPDLDDISLDILFKNLANEFDAQATESGINLTWPSQPHFVHSERALLEQVLRNLISNAIRHTPDGSVEISCRTQADAVEISVVDTGHGIPSDALETIFEEFQQLDTPNNAGTKGLGLGLSIAKRAAILLGCDISVKSELKKGSTFSITVPIGQAIEVRSPAQEAILPGTQLDQPYVVLIDDDALVLEGLCDLFTAWGYQSVSALDIDNMVKKLDSREDLPIAIISDYGLNDERTGVEAIRICRTLFNSEIPALLVTGDIHQELLVELDTGNIPVLHKPAAPAKLRAFLRRAEQASVANR